MSLRFLALVGVVPLASCVPASDPLSGGEGGGGESHAASTPQCALGAQVTVQTDEADSRPGYVRGRDGALLLAAIGAGDDPTDFDATRAQRSSPTGTSNEDTFAPAPCETGHLPLDAWSLDGRRLVRACGTIADSPDFEEELSAMPSTVDALRCAPNGCDGGDCAYTWLWLLTPRSCEDVALADATAPSGEYRIDPDGYAGSVPAVAADCRMEEGRGYTRVLGVDWTAGDSWIEALAAEPLGPGLVSAAAMRGYVDGSTLSSWPVADGHARYLFRCQAEGGAVVEVLTARAAIAMYLQGSAEVVEASGAFIRLDTSSYLTDKAFAWGNDQTGTWGDPVVATQVADRIALVPMVLYGGNGFRHASFRVQAGQMQCDDRAPNTSGRWDVWIR